MKSFENDKVKNELVGNAEAGTGGEVENHNHPDNWWEPREDKVANF